MPAPSPHHRFHVQGPHGQLTFHAGATLSAPWTLLFGPSGSGKSTLLRALAGLSPSLRVGLDRFDPGTASWVPLAGTPTSRRQLSWDPQQSLLLPHLTVEANLRFPEQLRSVPVQQSRLAELSQLLELDSLLTKRPHQLSGGERQRVSLARALAVPDARLLLLDEPFAGLDRARRDHLLPRLQAHLAARALPVLSVSHDPDEALVLNAEILRLNDGQLTAQGPVHRVLSDELQRLGQLLQRSGLAAGDP